MGWPDRTRPSVSSPSYARWSSSGPLTPLKTRTTRQPIRNLLCPQLTLSVTYSVRNLLCP
jgi:hypothetical protein